MTIERHKVSTYPYREEDTGHAALVRTPFGDLSIVAQTWHNVEEPDEDEIVVYVPDLKMRDAIRVVDGSGNTYYLHVD